jgi:hypothetical protein
MSDDITQIQDRAKALSWVSIFTSSGTLICCALPALLVSIGAGASLASLLGNVPQLIWFSENKSSVFLFASIMLAIAGYFQYRNRSAPCPVDPALAQACMATRRTSWRIYVFSVVLFMVGGFFAFAAPLLRAN